MKRVLIVVAISFLVCSTAIAGQGGGGESTKPKPSPKKTSGTRSSTTPPRSAVPPARPKSPTVANLMVNSNLPDATVKINGRTAGTTDSTGHLVIGSMKPGVYNVTITKPGYQPDKTVVNLSAGQSEALNFELKPFTQSLNITSTPPDCEIFVDDVLRGHTDASGNVRLAEVPVGDHRVTVRKARYREASFPLSVSADKEGQINAKLELAIGFLTVTTNAPNASIDISGVGHFASPLNRFECQPGAYSITISNPLYVTSRKEVSISAGQEAQLSVDLEADKDARFGWTAEALEAYSSKQYERAISLAKTVLSADPKHSQALTVLAQSYFMKDDFNSFTQFGSEAIEAGGSLEFPLRHNHGAGASVMHPVRLVLTAQALSFDPQLGPDVWCSNKPFTVSLKALGAAEVSGNRDNEINLRLGFVDPNNPKKTTTLSFADRESYLVEKGKTTAGGFVRYIGHSMVSRRQAYGAMTALAALLNTARARMKGVAGNPDSKVPATTDAGTGTIDDINRLGALPDSRVPRASTVTSPDPELAFAGRETFQSGGRSFTRYKFTVTNRNNYSQDMFASAPDLPPCGSNTKASRTWVDIYDRRGKRLYGFCAFGKPDDLGGIWFALEEGIAPPSEVFVVLRDRLSKKEYKSNLAAIP